VLFDRPTLEVAEMQ